MEMINQSKNIYDVLTTGLQIGIPAIVGLFGTWFAMKNNNKNLITNTKLNHEHEINKSKLNYEYAIKQKKLENNMSNFEKINQEIQEYFLLTLSIMYFWFNARENYKAPCINELSPERRTEYQKLYSEHYNIHIKMKKSFANMQLLGLNEEIKIINSYSSKFSEEMNKTSSYSHPFMTKEEAKIFTNECEKIKEIFYEKLKIKYDNL